jgi:hypothetical protein
MLQKYTNTLPIPLNEDTFRFLMSFLDLAGKLRIVSTCKALYKFSPMNEYFKINILPRGAHSLTPVKILSWIDVIFPKDTNQRLREDLRKTLRDATWNNKASEILCLKGDESLPEEQRMVQLPVELNTQDCKILWLFKLTYSSSVIELFEKCKSLEFFICQNTTLKIISYECQLEAPVLRLAIVSPSLVYLHLEYCIVEYYSEDLLLSCTALKKAQLINNRFKELQTQERTYLCPGLAFPENLEVLVFKHEASTVMITVLSENTLVE